MSVIHGKIMGTARKRTGDVVFRKWRSATISSVYQPIVKNPRSAAQQIQRAIFTVLSKLAVDFSPVLYIGMGDFVRGSMMSPRNAFVKYSKGAITALTPDNITTDWEKIVVSKGGLPKMGLGALGFDNPLEVEIPCSVPMSLQGYTSDLKVYNAIYCIDLDEFLVKEDVATSPSITVTVPGHWSGQKVHVWQFVVYTGANVPEYGYYTGQTSDSVYMGSGNVS